MSRSHDDRIELVLKGGSVLRVGRGFDAVTLDRLGDELRTHEMVEEAVLTLATPDRPSLQLD